LGKTIVLGILANAAFVALIGLLLFGCAGRLDLPMFWAFLAVWFATGLIGAFVADPTLAKERMRPGPGGRDYFTLVVMGPLWVVQHVVAGLDVGRFHWTDTVPFALQVVGLAAMAAGMAVMLWAVAVNRFFSSVIRIQTDRGHHLVTSGPYWYVRHPAYAIAVFFLVGAGLALGSWLAAVIGAVMVPGILRRTAMEDRFLLANLDGYAAYAQTVRYRVLPGVW
jgi:protein-S-isoprenylcysteine O-methyltransferase Ste14